MNDTKIPIIAVIGPTASGKTSLAISIAKHIGAEVVSCDSMQIYKELCIASAKPTPDEMQEVPHHMIDIVSCKDSFSVADYVALASKKIKDIHFRKRPVVLCGGTGLYVDSLLNCIDFSDNTADNELRNKLKEQYLHHGGEYMYKLLCDVDKAASEKIHPNNIKRVLRALEIYYSSGRSKTEQDEIARNNESIYHTLYIGINYNNRDVLYDRINRRVDIMLTDGLLDEVKSFYNIDGVNTASQAIGCKELKPYLDGEKTLSECVEHLKMQTRRYAKRQLTWFGRNKDIYWVYPDVDDDYVNKAITLCEEFLRR